MPKITSFQGGFSNDKNTGPSGAFWNCAGIDYRKNSAYIELAKRNSEIFTTTSVPVVVTLWGNSGNISGDVVCITSNGKLINNAGEQGTTPSGTATNVFERNGIRYILGQNKIHRLSTGSLTSFDSDVPIGSGTTFSVSTVTRPVLRFYEHILIGNGTSVARFDASGAVTEWTTGTTQPVIGGLAGTVVALTQIGQNVYVWCTDRTNTILYIWDGLSNRPSQQIVYSDKPVANVALLGNMHYWWSRKGDFGLRTINIGESYQPQEYITSGYPDSPLHLKKGSDNNRMTVEYTNYGYVNAIETLGNKVLLPGMGCIYSFGQSKPGMPYSLSKEIIFPGNSVVAMVSGGFTTSSRDFGGMIAFAYEKVTGGFGVGIYNDGQKGESIASVYVQASPTFTVNMTNGSANFNFASGQTGGGSSGDLIWGQGIPNFTTITSYASGVMTMDVPYEGETGPVEINFKGSGFYESMEWLAPDMYKGESDKKITVPCYIPHSSCSIKVYEKRDQGSYKLIKTITITDVPGFGVIEIPSSGVWRTKQLKFQLFTTNADFSPRVYVGVDNQTQPVGQIK